MSTLRKIIYDLREVYKLYSDDSDITNEYLAYQVNIARALLLDQKFSSRSFIIPEKLRQHFHLDLELTDDNEFASLGKILRTKDPIEKPLEPFSFKSNMRINSGSISDVNFTWVLPERFPYVGRNKWVQNHIYVTLGSDFRLYFTGNNPNHKLLENIKLSMVCETPEISYLTAVNYNALVEFWDTEYPLEESMVTLVTDLITKKLTTNIQAKEDKSNDADA